MTVYMCVTEPDIPQETPMVKSDRELTLFDALGLVKRAPRGRPTKAGRRASEPGD